MASPAEIGAVGSLVDGTQDYFDDADARLSPSICSADDALPSICSADDAIPSICSADDALPALESFAIGSNSGVEDNDEAKEDAEPEDEPDGWVQMQKVRGDTETNGITMTAVRRTADDESIKALESRLSDMQRQFAISKSTLEAELALERKSRRGTTMIACAGAALAGLSILRKFSSTANKEALETINCQLVSKASESYLHDKLEAVHYELASARLDVQDSLKAKVDHTDIAFLRAQLHTDASKEVQDCIAPLREQLARSEEEAKRFAENVTQKADARQVIDMVGAIDAKFEEALKQKKDRTEYDRDMVLMKTDQMHNKEESALDKVDLSDFHWYGMNSQALSEKASLNDTVAMFKALEEKLEGNIDRVQKALDDKAGNKYVEAELKSIHSQLESLHGARAKPGTSARPRFHFKLDSKAAGGGAILSSNCFCFAKGPKEHSVHVNGDRPLPKDGGVVYWEAVLHYLSPSSWSDLLRDPLRTRSIVGKVGISCASQVYWKCISCDIHRVGVRVDVDQRQAAFFSYSRTGRLMRVETFALGDSDIYPAFSISSANVRMRIVTGLVAPERVPQSAPRSSKL